MQIVFVAIIGWACHQVAAQEKSCSNFCSSLGILQTNPGKSCDDIYQINKASRGASGNYWINTTTGIEEVYCDMEIVCGSHKGGWMRIANLDTRRGDDCPSGWTKITTPVVACRAPSTFSGCYSTIFSTLSIPYNKICGMAVGYQQGSTDGFSNSGSINGPYLDGVSITYGNPRKHIWSYGIGITDSGNFENANCPCSPVSGELPPSFVHDHYYCESGTTDDVRKSGVLTSDPVWDGEGCSSGNNCCSEPSLPWFYRQIPMPTTEDIETRICRTEQSTNEDILVRDLQLYVQ